MTSGPDEAIQADGGAPDERGGTAGEQAARFDEPPLRVTTLELFFDLVFAFTLTQLATLLAAGSPRRTWRGCC